MDQAVYQNGFKHVQMLPAYDDELGGVVVEMEEPVKPNDFCVVLRHSLSQWKLQGKKGVWLKLPIELVNLVEIAVKYGFSYHHAEPHYLMFVYWIPDTLCTIPANATHRPRIGAIIMNDKRELLVVLEKYGRLKGTGIWKIPTGMLEEGEDIFTGARREVKEETGIDTEFMDVLAFRFRVHIASKRISPSLSNFMTGKPTSPFSGSRTYFFYARCDFDIQKQDSEIEAAKWMPIAEYAAQPFQQGYSVCKYVADVCLANIDTGCSTGSVPLPVTSFSNDQISYLYVNKQDFNPL